MKTILQQAESFLRDNPEFADRLVHAKSIEDYAQGLRDLLQSKPSALVTLTNIGNDWANTCKEDFNPLIQAAVAERVFLDGDAPELRSGPIPENGKPAVPVVTTSRNLVQVGMMLERASEQVQAKYRAALTAQDTALAKVEPITGIVGYEAGRFPTPVEVPEPTAGEMAALSKADERLMVWKAISTTQGRRSLLGSLRSGLSEAYPNLEFAPTVSEASADSTSWVVQVFGAEDLESNFQAIESALAKFIAFLKPYKAPVVVLQAVNGVSSRTFGWTIYAWEKK